MAAPLRRPVRRAAPRSRRGRRSSTSRTGRVLRIAGPDRLSWLHSLLTQHSPRWRPAAWTQALVLSPQGHVEHHLHLVDDGEAVLAHVEPGTGRGAGRVPAPDAVHAPGRGHRRQRRRGPSSPTPRCGSSPRADLAAYDGPVAGVGAYEALRVAARAPRLGLDTDHRTLPHEVGWLTTAVHLDKGCYRGQETVARVHNLGRPPRRLVLLHLDGSDSELPATGADVVQDGRDRRAGRHRRAPPRARPDRAGAGQAHGRRRRRPARRPGRRARSTTSRPSSCRCRPPGPPPLPARGCSAAAERSPPGVQDVRSVICDDGGPDRTDGGAPVSVEDTASSPRPGNRRIDRVLAEDYLDGAARPAARRGPRSCAPTPSRRRSTCPTSAA